jgi:hypothetical protein
LIFGWSLRFVLLLSFARMDSSSDAEFVAFTRAYSLVGLGVTLGIFLILLGRLNRLKPSAWIAGLTGIGFAAAIVYQFCQCSHG